MRMRRIALFIVCLLFAFCTKGQNRQVSVDFYGFIRTDVYVDTYKGVDAGHDIFYLMPKYDAVNGIKDVNQQTSSNISAIASRFGLKLAGPDLFNAKTRGLMELDFAGNLKADPTLFRIRQAYMSFAWEKSSLLVGHTWHPFSGGTFMPVVAGLNTGAPFNCFNRSPQIRYDYRIKDVTLSATALSELQYCSPTLESGTYSTPNHAKRNGVVPELVFSSEYKKNAYIAGVGVEYKRIKPRMEITGTEGFSVSDEYLSSYALTAYMCYKKEKFMVLAKGFYGQNMSHMTLPGGYAIATRDAETGKETYTSYNAYTALLNATYGVKWQGGLFLGYGGNLGTSDPVHNFAGIGGRTFGMMQSAQSMFRVAPHVSYNVANFRAVAEYEVSSARYGVGDSFDFSNGLYNSTHDATNNRFILVLMYMF